MNEEFYRRQTEEKQNLEHHNASINKNSTLETYNLEQQEAHAGHIPAPQGAAEQPSLWARLKKMIGL